MHPYAMSSHPKRETTSASEFKETREGGVYVGAIDDFNLARGQLAGDGKTHRDSVVAVAINPVLLQLSYL